MKLNELKSPAEVTELEKQLDKLFRPLGLDVEFSRHFVERILQREKAVTIEEVTTAFSKLKKKYKNRLLKAKKKQDYEAILKDFSNEINVVFSIDGDEMTAITIKSKDPSQFHANKKGGEELKVQ
jgi:hypothetical protein